jgi:lipopolysaccharide transport system ATP-binding protein
VTAQALTVSSLGKAFGVYRSEWQRLLSWCGVSVKPASEHWVLRDVTFSASIGEAVGIVGQNGAGKSTLLKLIAGTSRPTEGGVATTGRVAAILELGMGFNPELTGRQNAFHAGGLMGFERGALLEAMPSIQAFADVGEYFDQPLRTYSSGMQVRVAFAVATAFRPEILIIDEALAVGDAAFQRKCFQRIEDFCAAGTTLLFVSHDLETVRKICSRAAFLCQGRLARFGAAKLVCDEYEQYLFGVEPDRTAPASAPQTARFDPDLTGTTCEVVYGNDMANIESCRIENMKGERINVVETGQPFVWRFQVAFNRPTREPIFAMMIKTREGVTLYGVDSTRWDTAQRDYLPGEIADVRFELTNSLAPGVYYLNCGVKVNTGSHVEFLSRRIDAAIIRVTASATSTALVGLVDLEASLAVTATAATQG